MTLYAIKISLIKCNNNYEVIDMMFKKYRLLRGLTQEQLAEKVEITWRQMQRIEKGNSLPSLLTLKKLIIVLDISDKDVADFIKSL